MIQPYPKKNAAQVRRAVRTLIRKAKARRARTAQKMQAMDRMPFAGVYYPRKAIRNLQYLAKHGLVRA